MKYVIWMQFNMDDLYEENFKELAHAIIIQAVLDWRRLASGGFATKDCNFEELRDFFTYDCDALMEANEYTGAEILKFLEEDQRKGIKRDYRTL